MLDPYKSAKIEKLKQLKKLMYELMAEEGVEPDEEISEGGLHEAMEAAEDETQAGEDQAELPSDPMSELKKMKEEYFKPKVRERRPGTAIMFESISAKPMPKSKGKYK